MSSPSSILNETAHRPWPLPKGPWVMQQTWCDLLFAHWPLPPEQLRALIPDELSLDTFDGRGWIAITPFHMRIRVRGTPFLPSLSHFPEINCRTYVTSGGKPGIYFFSLDAGSRMAVWGARALYSLPYFYAHMRVESGRESIGYTTRRADGGAARLAATYRPQAEVWYSKPGSLEHWLTERYCLYAMRGRVVHRGEIHHAPWPLQDATAEIRENTMAAAAGIILPKQLPLLHFVRKLEVLLWPLRKA